jgi:hypothetical protein
MDKITLRINDETASGKSIHEVLVSFKNELTTVEEIITARVSVEVEAYNYKLPDYFQGLVQPQDAESTLNGYKLKERRKKIDLGKQCRVALDAFKNNGYFVFIDNIQAKSLDQMVVINEQTKISFVKLTPLIGG